MTNLLEDVARALELVTPAAPGLFLPLAASATFVRSAALTGRGSLMNGTFMQHLGRNQNLGDVRAKLEVQGRWLALVALPVGIGIFRYVSSAFGADDAGDGISRYSVTIGAYSTIVGGHALCCWKAAKVLRFDTLNRARLLNAAAAFVGGGVGAVPSVEEAGEAEGVFRARVLPGTPTLGASLPDAARNWEQLEALIALEGAAGAGTGNGTGTGTGGDQEQVSQVHRDEVGVDDDDDDDEGFIVEDGARRRFVLGWDASRRTPAVLLDAAASPRDVIAAALAATHAAAAASSSSSSSSSSSGVDVGDDRLDAEIAAAAYAYSDRHLDEFEGAMRAVDWRTDFVQMGTAPKYRLAALV